MVEYSKPWLPIDQQIAKLQARGVDVPDHDECARLLRAIGYYRLTGYLYPFRSAADAVVDGQPQRQIFSEYAPGTSILDAAQLIDFDRQLRMICLDGVERIEIALRMQIGYVLGRQSPFAHLAPSTFTAAFTTADPTRSPESKHEALLEKLLARQSGSDEAFVAHFRTKYDGRMPIWALTEIMEMGHLSRLYQGLSNDLATEIATAFHVPSKRLLASWVASLNYVRNVSAHHARLFNRKLQTAPKRPPRGQIPMLDHLQQQRSAKEMFGTYNALAIMAYLLRQIEPRTTWPANVHEHLRQFPASARVPISSMGVPDGWESLELWQH